MSNAEQLSNEVSKERQMAKAAPGPVELQSLPTRKYLDETVMPLLLEGLAILSKVWARNLENNFLENSIASLNRRFKKFFLGAPSDGAWCGWVARSIFVEK